MRPIAAIILAAGESSRLGQPKQLLTFAGETLLRRAVRAADEGGCAPVVVVLGDLLLEMESQLRGARVQLVENVNWSRGLGTSVRAGVQHLLDSSVTPEAAVLLACDQPFADAALVRALLAERERSGKPIVASSYGDVLGIPALFDRSCFDALVNLPDAAGAKRIIAAESARVATVPFAGGAFDVDTPHDLTRLIACEQKQK